MMMIGHSRLGLDAIQTHHLPRGARALGVDILEGIPRLWVMFDPSAEIEVRTIRLIGSGDPINDHPGVYVGTVRLSDTSRHVFINPTPESEGW
jgi:hypothetical protein